MSRPVPLIRWAAGLTLAATSACATSPEAGWSEPEVLTARTFIEASYDAVWDRFTQASAFEDWYTVACRQFGSSVGDELLWGTEERDVYRGRLLRIDKGAGVAWEFRFVGFDFEEPMTRVDVAIIDRGPTVLVAVRHDVAHAPRTAAIISPVGWPKLLARLKTLLETGEPMPWPVQP